jgi:hypothetical protein
MVKCTSKCQLMIRPYLADLFRRTVLPLDRFVLKIAAIEHRTKFHVARAGGEYLGLELGADVTADVKRYFIFSHWRPTFLRASIPENGLTGCSWSLCH